MIIGCKLHYLDEVDSTNEYARTLIDKEPEGTVVFAHEQTAGKGRVERRWYSPPGGIWMSVILKPEKLYPISLMAGVSVCETFHTYNILLGLKWPNDVMLNKKKVAGVLTEVVDDRVILGIGINLNIHKFPDELSNIASSILLETKKSLDKMMVFQLLCRELDDHYLMMKNGKTQQILTKWRHYTIMLGKQVRVEFPDKAVTGRVIDIGGDGSLVIMMPDGKIERVVAGDCRIVSSM